jgi:hypothetical protein
MVFLVIMQQADQGSVISELNEVSVRRGTSTTISVQEWGLNTSLRRAFVGGAYVRQVGGPTLIRCDYWLRMSNSHKTSPPI